jgi:histidinol-phosphate phosphatase family protein
VPHLGARTSPRLEGDLLARAVFLDRDGTLIEDVGYLRDPGQVRLIPGAAHALAELRRARYRLVLVSNQAGIGRGVVSEAEAAAVHRRILGELERAGTTLDDARYCPHAPPVSCACRKPSAGLLLAAARELGLDLSRSVMVGDKPSDVEAGRRAGCRTVFLSFGRAADTEADLVACSWDEIVAFVLHRGTPWRPLRDGRATQRSGGGGAK